MKSAMFQLDTVALWRRFIYSEVEKKKIQICFINSFRYLDWMNILSYDYHSAFEPSVNHHAPLYPLEEDDEYNYDAELNIVSIHHSIIKKDLVITFYSPVNV